MTSTFVNNLALNEMATGDQSGSWGNVTNLNLELIGEGLGFATEAPFNTDANKTTTVAPGASDPARAMYFKVTSTVSGGLTATRQLTIDPDTINRLMFIENATTGGESITIKQGSGSGAAVTIPNGDTKAVILSGSGSGSIVLDAFASLSVVDLNVSGAVDIDGAVQIDNTLSVGVDDTGYDVKFFGATASAFMLWDASADDLILGGAAGLSVNSAALVTGVLTTTAEVVLNGGAQINAAVNVGVDDQGYDFKFFGDTASKYMRWDASSNSLIFTDDSKIQMGNSSDFLIYHDPNVNIIHAATSNQDIEFRGNDNGSAITVLTLDMSAGGRALFNNASSDQMAIFTNTANDSIVQISATAANKNSTIYFGDNDDANVGNIDYDHNDNSLSFIVNASKAASFDSTRRLLIGPGNTRTIDGYNQHVLLEGVGIDKASMAIATHTNDSNGAYFYLSKARGSTVGGSTIVQNNDVSGAIIFTAADGTDMTSKVAQIQANLDGTPGANDTPGRLQFYTTPDGTNAIVERLRISNTGVSTFTGSNDGTNLLITSGTDNNYLGLGAANNFGSNNNTQTKWTLRWRGRPTSSGVHTLTLVDEVNSQERLLFTTNGESLTHTTSDNGVFRNSCTSTSYGSIGITSRVARNSSNGQYFHFSAFDSATDTYRFQVHDDGDVVNVNNSYGAISDVKLKENIADAASQWDDIKALTVRKYSMKSDNLDAPNKLGVISQELEAAGMGGLITDVSDRDAEGVVLDTSTKHVKYSILYMKAIKALQEAMTRIETLETKVAALEG